MSILSTIFAPLYFTRVPATILAVIFYAFILESVLYTDYLPKVKSSVQFEKALADLSNITARPHPYISHANDHVKSYLLSRIQSMGSDLEIIDDTNSTVKYAGDYDLPRAVYFEGTNILVKVPGSEQSDTNAVLFSAHYDSVSSAPGATDNAIGLVAMIQLLERLAALPMNQRPRRTAIFNFNNNEEDGLFGAFAFLAHPWSNLTTKFLNVDGAGAGGRPMLFRTTSMSPTASFIRAHPKAGYYHANVLSQDAFGTGAIRSDTDWSVYKRQMDGVDLAFYKNRAYYHTKYDSLSYAEGGPRAVQAMIETVRFGGLGLLNSDLKANTKHKAPVYFDVFGKFLVLVEMNSVFVTNVVFLVVGPILVIIFLIVELALSDKSSRHHSSSETSSFWTTLWKGIKNILGATQFWVSLLVAAAAQIALAGVYLRTNPYVVHSHPTLVLACVLSLAYLGIVLPIQVLQYTGISATKSKLVSFASLYLFTWILLVVSTVYMRKSKIGSTYWITIWNACAFLGFLISLVQAVLSTSTGGKLGGDAAVYDEIVDDAVEDSEEDVQDGTRKYVRGIEHRAEPEGSEEHDEERYTRETEPTEITPLMQQHRGEDGSVVALDTRGTSGSKASDGDEIGWWLLQMIITVPIPALLVYDITNLLLDSLSQTMVDGSSVVTVYAVASALSILILLPLTPFAQRMHGLLTWVVFIVFVLTALYSLITFPFTPTTPMKFRFQQLVDVDSQTSSLSPSVKATTSILGLPNYVDKVIAALPSSRGKNVTCVTNAVGLDLCSWEVDQEYIPSPGGKGSDPWIQSNATRLNERSTASITVQGRNTRGCKIYFDTAIQEYDVREVDGEGWAGEVPVGYTAVPHDGVEKLTLWSRTWDRKFEVQVRWRGSGSLTGRVACMYAEYMSGLAGDSDEHSRRSGMIPAYEEVLRFAPSWAVVTKAGDGLVEVSKSFEV